MWKEQNNQLQKKFSFKDFIEAFAFISKIALLSEQMNHHATIHNTYNVVEIFLTTHDDGNTVTAKDIKMAEKIDAFIVM